MADKDYVPPRRAAGDRGDLPDPVRRSVSDGAGQIPDEHLVASLPDRPGHGVPGCRSDRPRPRTGRCALLYHSGHELLTDWPGLFASAGFQLGKVYDIQAQTLPTWQHVQATYRQHAEQIQARYGRRLGAGIARQAAQVAAAIERCGSYPALSATAPSTPAPSPQALHHTSANPGQTQDHR